MSHPHLRNAPITEAVLEIRTALPDDVGEGDLNRFAEAISANYTKRRERLQFSVGFQGGTPTGSEATVDGLLIEHETHPNIVQARLDGFAFSRLHPYEDWESFQSEALPLWNLYREVLRPIRIVRVALRYINTIELDVSEDPSLTLAVLPGVPAPMAPVGLTSFTMQMLSEHPDFGAAAKVIEHLAPLEPGVERVQVMLDIDVFKTLDLSPEDPALWEHFDQLRELKNSLFFSSITPQARERYQHGNSVPTG